jgi:surface polysaccharide O-acyltransferase-like enzyme
MSPEPEKTRRIVLFVWIAMVASVAMHVALTQVLEPGPAMLNSPLRIPFYALAFVSAIASVYFKSRFGARQGKPRSLGMVRAGYIVSLAFCEVPSLLGLILFFAGHAPNDWLLFVISALAFGVNFPAVGDFDSVNS